MSAADRMVVRTLDGSYRSVPRRQGLGMIAAGRAQHAPAPLEVGAGDHDARAELLDGGGAPVTTVDIEITTTPEMAKLIGLTPSEPVVYPESPTEQDAYEAGFSSLADFVASEYPAARELPAEPRGNASRQEWAAYAHDIGVEVHAGMSRNQIRDAAQDATQSLARLPQPALTGGRLETPEDEPVTEESVTDDEDPGTR